MLPDLGRNNLVSCVTSKLLLVGGFAQRSWLLLNQQLSSAAGCLVLKLCSEGRQLPTVPFSLQSCSSIIITRATSQTAGSCCASERSSQMRCHCGVNSSLSRYEGMPFGALLLNFPPCLDHIVCVPRPKQGSSFNPWSHRSFGCLN